MSHNLGQILMAMLVLQTKLLIYYYPFLIVTGVAAGFFVGMLSALLVKRLKPLYSLE